MLGCGDGVVGGGRDANEDSDGTAEVVREASVERVDEMSRDAVGVVDCSSDRDAMPEDVIERDRREADNKSDDDRDNEERDDGEDLGLAVIAITVMTLTKPSAPGDPGAAALGGMPSPEDTREEDAHEEPPPPPVYSALPLPPP